MVGAGGYSAGGGAAEGSALRVVVLLRRAKGSAAPEHVRVDDADGGGEVGRGLVVERGVAAKHYAFSCVLGPGAGLRQAHQIAQQLARRARAPGQHPVLLTYGVQHAARPLVLGDERQGGLVPHVGEALVEAHGGDADVAVHVQLLKGERAVTEVLPPTPVGRRGGAAVLESLPGVLARREEHGTLLVTYTVAWGPSGGLQASTASGRAPVAVSKVSVVLFEAAGKPSPSTRKHPLAVRDVMKALHDAGARQQGGPEGAVRCATRQSKLTQMLHAADPPAFAPGQQVLFLATSTTAVDDARENVLKFASEVYTKVGGAGPTALPVRLPAGGSWRPGGSQQSLPTGVDAADDVSSSPPPDPCPPPAHVAWTASQQSRVGDDAAALSWSAREDVAALRHFEHRQQQLDARQQRAGQRPARTLSPGGHVRALEKDLVQCKASLYESREAHAMWEQRCGESERRLQDALEGLEGAKQEGARAAREAAALKEGKRRLQVRVSECEQAKEAQEKALLVAERRLAVVSGEKMAAARRLAEMEAELEELRDHHRGAAAAAQYQSPSHRSVTAEDDSSARLSHHTEEMSGTEAPATQHHALIVPQPLQEWRNAYKDEALVLRGHLEEAQSHVRKLSQQLAGLGGEDEEAAAADGEVAMLARSLEMQQDLSRRYCAKLESYERRLEAVLCHGDDGIEDAAVDADALRFVQTAADKYERLWRRAELDFQEAKLHMQAQEAHGAARVKELNASVAALQAAVREHERSAAASPQTRQAEGERAQLMDRLQRQLRGLAGKDAEKERLLAAFTRELEALREENGALTQSVAGLQRVEQTSHLNLTKLAEASLTNSQLKSELDLLRDEVDAARDEAAAAKQQLAAARADAEQTKRHNEELGEGLNGLRSAAGGMEAQCAEYERKLQEMHDGYVEKTTYLTDSLRTEKAEVHALRAAKDALEAEVAVLRDDTTVQNRRSCALDVQNDRLEEEAAAAKAAGKAAEARAAELQAQLRRAQSDVQGKAAEIATLTDRLEAATQLTEHYRDGETRRFEGELQKQLQTIKDAQHAAQQHKMLTQQLQVKTALVARLEKQLAKASRS